MNPDPDDRTSSTPSNWPGSRFSSSSLRSSSCGSRRRPRPRRRRPLPRRPRRRFPSCCPPCPPCERAPPPPDDPSPSEDPSDSDAPASARGLAPSEAPPPDPPSPPSPLPCDDCAGPFPPLSPPDRRPRGGRLSDGVSDPPWGPPPPAVVDSGAERVSGLLEGEPVWGSDEVVPDSGESSGCWSVTFVRFAWGPLHVSETVVGRSVPRRGIHPSPGHPGVLRGRRGRLKSISPWIGLAGPGQRQRSGLDHGYRYWRLCPQD